MSFRERFSFLMGISMGKWPDFEYRVGKWLEYDRFGSNSSQPTLGSPLNLGDPWRPLATLGDHAWKWSKWPKWLIWEIISSFILVRSWFNCQIQFKNIHNAINRGRNEMRKCCIFCPCMRLMRIKIFTCALRCAYPHMRIIRMNRMDPQPHGQVANPA